MPTDVTFTSVQLRPPRTCTAHSGALSMPGTGYCCAEPILAGLRQGELVLTNPAAVTAAAADAEPVERRQLEALVAANAERGIEAAQATVSGIEAALRLGGPLRDRLVAALGQASKGRR